MWGPSVIDFPPRRSKPLVTLDEIRSRCGNVQLSIWSVIEDDIVDQANSLTRSLSLSRYEYEFSIVFSASTLPKVSVSSNRYIILGYILGFLLPCGFRLFQHATLGEDYDRD